MDIAQTPENPMAEHPIDIVEALAASREWPFERGAQDEMNVCITGAQSDYHMSISWRPELGGLHLASILDTRTPEKKRAELHELLALINEQLWLGNFDIWEADGTILYRNTLLVSGEGLSEGQCDRLIGHAIETCDRFFPAFQFLIWGNHTPKTVLGVCLFETQGDA